MRITKFRTLAVVAATTLLVGGTAAVAWGGAVDPGQAQRVSSVMWCQESDGVMRQVAAESVCEPGEAKYLLKSGSGPAGPRGPKGATGPRG